MSKKTFSTEEVSILSENKYVKRVSSKAISYTEEFKIHFIAETQKGKSARQVFVECGFDTDIIGKKRIKSANDRWRATHKRDGVIGLKDTRSLRAGRPRKKELTLEQENKRLEAELKLVRAENELLKKLDMLEMMMLGED